MTWETLDLEAPYPKAHHRAQGRHFEWLISEYRIGRDNKKFDRGPRDNWTLSTEPSSFVSYHPTLDDAKAHAESA
jgi:hypothetical protein